MSHSTEKIRNVCFLGHGGSGKTTLSENMLFFTGAIDRQGSVPAGNTVSDSDEQEHRRQISISASIIPIQFGGCKINILDCPGFPDFAGEAKSALHAAETGIIFCTAKDGVGVGAERNFKYLKQSALPTILYISKIDEENGDYSAVLDSMKNKFGSSVCAVTIPLTDGSGVIDLVSNTAYQTVGGKTSKIPIPAADADTVSVMRDALFETAAGADEALMEKYFESMELSAEDTIKGLQIGLRERSVFPVFCGSGVSGVGTTALLQAICDYAPSPLDVKTILTASGERLSADPSGATCAYVFKTVSDQFGKLSLIKVFAGSITPDHSLRDSRTDSSEKLGRLYSISGKKTAEVKEIICGDIGAVGKMEWKTGDTVSDPKSNISLPPISVTDPCYSMAIYPKVKGQEDKIASGLSRLNEEDVSFRVVNNGETHQMVISGIGDIQLDVLCAKLKARYGVESELQPAKVPYREKIKKKVEAHGRHKKQSGGSGQFGDVWIRFEPQFDSEDLVFADAVFGGSVPKNFFPAVEKGLRDSIRHGVLAGYPVVNLKATLYDGSYHPVDSNEIAFKTAAQIAYRAGIPEAQPTLLEPIGALAVTVPSDFMGDVIGDLNKRRGHVIGMNPDDDGNTVIEAEVPMAEMSSYTLDLRSMTQGRGSFVFRFDRYEEAPATVQQKVIEEAKAHPEEHQQ